MNKITNSCNLQTYLGMVAKIFTNPTTGGSGIWQFQLMMINNYLAKKSCFMIFKMAMIIETMKQIGFLGKGLNLRGVMTTKV